MKLLLGQMFSNAGHTDLGELAGDKSMNLYLVEMKIGLNQIAFHLDCDGRNPKFEAYADICKPRFKGVDWDQTIFPTEADARERARKIISIEYPHLNLSKLN